MHCFWSWFKGTAENKIKIANSSKMDVNEPEMPANNAAEELPLTYIGYNNSGFISS